ASEQRTEALCQLTLDLSRVTSPDELFGHAQRHLRGLFGEATELSVSPHQPPLEAEFTTQVIRDHDHQVAYIRVRQSSVLGDHMDRRLLLVACADRIADALKLFALGDAAR